MISKPAPQKLEQPKLAPVQPRANVSMMNEPKINFDMRDSTAQETEQP
jgi:hypothetical protein